MAIAAGKKIVKKTGKTYKKFLKAGEAAPGPALGAFLGPKGVNMVEFCKKFNERTQGIEKGTPLNVWITINPDRTFAIEVGTPLTSPRLLKAGGVEKGSATPQSVKVAKITQAQLEEIARLKLPDLTAKDVQAAMRTIAGSARSMGIEISEG